MKTQIDQNQWADSVASMSQTVNITESGEINDSKGVQDITNELNKISIDNVLESADEMQFCRDQLIDQDMKMVKEGEGQKNKQINNNQERQVVQRDEMGYKQGDYNEEMFRNMVKKLQIEKEIRERAQEELNMAMSINQKLNKKIEMINSNQGEINEKIKALQDENQLLKIQNVDYQVELESPLIRDSKIQSLKSSGTGLRRINTQIEKKENSSFSFNSVQNDFPQDPLAIQDDESDEFKLIEFIDQLQLKEIESSRESKQSETPTLILNEQQNTHIQEVVVLDQSVSFISDRDEKDTQELNDNQIMFPPRRRDCSTEVINFSIKKDFEERVDFSVDSHDNVEEVNSGSFIDINDEVQNTQIEEPGYLKTAFYVTLGIAIVAKNKYQEYYR